MSNMKEEKSLLDANHDFWANCVFTQLAGEAYYKTARIILNKICEKIIGDTFLALDIGCGNGEFTKEISRFCHKITGMDLSAPLLEYARDNFAGPNIKYQQLDLEKPDFILPAEQDAIFCMGVFATIHGDGNMGRILEAFRNALKNGGYLITRDTCSQHGTFSKAYDNGYFACYRAHSAYLAIIEAAGFQCSCSIGIWNNRDTRNDYYIFKADKNALPG